MNQAPIVTATPPATPLKSALKQPTPPMAPTQPQETQEAQAAKPWAPKPVVAPQSKVQESDLTGSMSGQPQSNFMAPTKGMSLLVYRSGFDGLARSRTPVRSANELPESPGRGVHRTMMFGPTP